MERGCDVHLCEVPEIHAARSAASTGIGNIPRAGGPVNCLRLSSPYGRNAPGRDQAVYFWPSLVMNLIGFILAMHAAFGRRPGLRIKARLILTPHLVSSAEWEAWRKMKT